MHDRQKTALSTAMYPPNGCHAHPALETEHRSDSLWFYPPVPENILYKTGYPVEDDKSLRSAILLYLSPQQSLHYHHTRKPVFWYHQ